MFLTVNSNIQWKMCPVLVWQMNGSWDTTNKLLQLTCLPQFHISNSHTAEQKAGQLAQGVQRHNKLIYALNGERETCFTHTAAELSWLSTLPYAAACCAAEIFQLQTYSPSGLMYFRALSGEAGNAQLWFFIQVGREGNISLGGCCLLFINLIHLLVREGSSAKTSQLQMGLAVICEGLGQNWERPSLSHLGQQPALLQLIVVWHLGCSFCRSHCNSEHCPLWRPGCKRTLAAKCRRCRNSSWCFRDLLILVLPLFLLALALFCFLVVDRKNWQSFYPQLFCVKPVLWQPKSHYLIFFIFHRITESQNSRGWKGPLWVI